MAWNLYQQLICRTLTGFYPVNSLWIEVSFSVALSSSKEQLGTNIK